MTLRRTVAIAGAAIGILALIAQFYVIVSLVLSERGPVGAVIYYFSFFTILTNLLLVLVYLGAIVRGQRWLVFFRKPHTRAMAASSIVLVGGFYHFVLSGVWEQEGLLYWCNIALHYVTPALYVVWFAAWNRTGTLKWSSLVTLLAYPVAYLIYVLLRGALTGDYPYEILDVGLVGYPGVAANAAGLMVLLLLFNAAAIAIDRSLLMKQEH